MTQTIPCTLSPEELSKKGIEVSLRNIHSQRIYLDGNHQDYNYDLTDKDIEGIVDLLGGWIKTRKRIRSILTYSFTSLRSAWWMERLHYCKYSNRWVYTAGQDYPSELRTIRQDIVK